MPVDTFQLKSVAIKCLQGCWGPRHEKINGVSHSKITHCAVLISVSVMIARKYKYWFWYCIRNNLAISKYSISNPNQRLSHNSGDIIIQGRPVVMLWSVLPFLLLHKSQHRCLKKGRERDSFLPL